MDSATFLRWRSRERKGMKRRLDCRQLEASMRKASSSWKKRAEACKCLPYSVLERASLWPSYGSSTLSSLSSTSSSLSRSPSRNSISTERESSAEDLQQQHRYQLQRHQQKLIPTTTTTTITHPSKLHQKENQIIQLETRNENQNENQKLNSQPCKGASTNSICLPCSSRSNKGEARKVHQQPQPQHSNIAACCYYCQRSTSTSSTSFKCCLNAPLLISQYSDHSKRMRDSRAGSPASRPRIGKVQRELIDQVKRNKKAEKLIQQQDHFSNQAHISNSPEQTFVSSRITVNNVNNAPQAQTSNKLVDLSASNSSTQLTKLEIQNNHTYSDKKSVDNFSKVNTESSAHNQDENINTQEDKKSNLRHQHIHWADINRRYRKMSASHTAAERTREADADASKSRLPWSSRTTKNSSSSCLHLFLSTCQFIFPILTAFQSYSLKNDLGADLVAGFTVAVLNIPQGMAYGILAGVTPIEGLYVSFVPVLVMAFMSKSRHVSQGTFAIVSMLLSSAIDSIKSTLKQHEAANSPELAALVLVNNHQPQVDHPSQQLLKEFLQIDTSTSSDNIHTHFTSVAKEDSIGSIHLPITDDYTPLPFPENIEILTSICLTVGIIQLLMASLRLGCVTLMFSDQLVSSFTTASAIHVGTSQLAGVFDLTINGVPDGLFKVCRTWFVVGERLLQGCNPYTAILSLFSILFLLVLKEFLEPSMKRHTRMSLSCLPSELLLMSILIFSSWYWNFADNFSIKILGTIPNQLPSPKLPRLDLTSLVLRDSFTIALVSFAMNLSIGQLYANRYKYKLNPNQELFALGTSNVIGSLFSCFPCSSSLSRSAVLSNLNARSPICSLFSCSMVVLMICYLGPLLYYLPRSTLSCIILYALKSILIQFKDFKENWRLSKLDALVWAATFISVISCGVIYGLIMGIIASLAIVLLRLCSLNYSILGQLPGTNIYVDLDSFMDCVEIEHVKIFKINSALCYLNKTTLKSSIENEAFQVRRNYLTSLFSSKRGRTYSIDCENKNKINFLIIDCSGLSYCDYSGVLTLTDCISELEARKIYVCLASCPLKLIKMLENLEKTKILEHNVYPLISDAVNHIKYLNSVAKMSDSLQDTSGNNIEQLYRCTGNPLSASFK